MIDAIIHGLTLLRPDPFVTLLGNILAVDRQTSVGVDIAEQTAVKTALQNAADALAERLLPKLAK